MRKENFISYHFIHNCTRIVMTDSVALFKRKNMIVKYFSYKTLLHYCLGFRV